MSAIEGCWKLIAPQLDTDCPFIIVNDSVVYDSGWCGMVKLFAPIVTGFVTTLLACASIIANPRGVACWAVRFREYKTVSFIALGAVVLSITGVEALYIWVYR